METKKAKKAKKGSKIFSRNVRGVCVIIAAIINFLVRTKFLIFRF
jgi:hypothetical protein